MIEAFCVNLSVYFERNRGSRDIEFKDRLMMHIVCGCVVYRFPEAIYKGAPLLLECWLGVGVEKELLGDLAGFVGYKQDSVVELKGIWYV